MSTSLNKSTISLILCLSFISELLSSNFKISEIQNGPQLKKKGLDMIAFTKAFNDMLSRIIANYFLSTIVADHIASAIFLLSTNASPLYFQTRP